MGELQSYCNAGSGDEIATFYKTSFQAIQNLDQDVCHSSMRRDIDCWTHKLWKNDETKNKYYEYLKALYEYYEYPMIQLSDACVAEAYFNTWYLANNSMIEGDNAFLLSISSLFVLLSLFI